VHKYGPHIFHTNSKEIFDYLSRFTAWRKYEHRVLASVDGKLLPVPINLDTINKFYNRNFSESAAAEFLASVAEPRQCLRTSEDVVVSRVGRQLYEKFFRGYTRKQWGVDPSELEAQVTARIPVRTNHDDRYFTDQFQFMPKYGYTPLFENMLDHPNIEIVLNADYREVEKITRCRKVIYTGPVDEFFGYRYGKLPYRSLKFQHATLDCERFQTTAVVNYPNDFSFTRITEFKHLTGQHHAHSSVVCEYPCAEGDPYYPIPQPCNAAIYAKYRELAARCPNVHFVGRLATYRYYNMDQVVGQALTLYRKLVKASEVEENNENETSKDFDRTLGRSRMHGQSRPGPVLQPA